MINFNIKHILLIIIWWFVPFCQIIAIRQIIILPSVQTENAQTHTILFYRSCIVFKPQCSMNILYTLRDCSTFWWLMNATYFPLCFSELTTKFLNPENACVVNQVYLQTQDCVLMVMYNSDILFSKVVHKLGCSDYMKYSLDIGPLRCLEKMWIKKKLCKYI